MESPEAREGKLIHKLLLGSVALLHKSSFELKGIEKVCLLEISNF